MQTPNGYNPVVLDITMSHQDIAIAIHGAKYHVPQRTPITVLLKTDKPMKLGEKYPPLMGISAGGRQANIHGLFAYEFICHVNDGIHSFENRCGADWVEWTYT